MENNYIIIDLSISATDRKKELKDFEQRVSVKIKDGYVLVGGVSVILIGLMYLYSQAMVKLS